MWAAGDLVVVVTTDPTVPARGTGTAGAHAAADTTARARGEEEDGAGGEGRSPERIHPGPGAR